MLIKAICWRCLAAAPGYTLHRGMMDMEAEKNWKNGFAPCMTGNLNLEMRRKTEGCVEGPIPSWCAYYLEQVLKANDGT